MSFFLCYCRLSFRGQTPNHLNPVKQNIPGYEGILYICVHKKWYLKVHMLLNIQSALQVKIKIWQQHGYQLHASHLSHLNRLLWNSSLIMQHFLGVNFFYLNITLGELELQRLVSYVFLLRPRTKSAHC